MTADKSPDASSGKAVTVPYLKTSSLKRTNSVLSTVSVSNSSSKAVSITDDAMFVELATNHDVPMIQGSYSNIKVTTPEDIAFGEAILRGRR